jgi:catalase
VKGSSPRALFLHTDHEKWVGEVSAHTSEITDADFVQPAALWEVIGWEPGHQDRLIDNLVSSVKGVKYTELRKAVYSTCPVQCTATFEKCIHCSASLTLNIGLFSRGNKDLGLRLQERTEAAIKAACDRPV